MALPISTSSPGIDAPRVDEVQASFLDTLRYDNAYVRELPGDQESGQGTRQVEGALYSRVDPSPVARPRLIAHSAEVAQLLDIDAVDVANPEFASVFSGNRILPGMQPYAANYGGHQFGHWAGQLGDGRAITLGETINARGERWEMQLKGAGPTPYSRRADGRAVLRSSVREFLCSEAMHHLGIPTTRALSLVATGDRVVRDMFYDGNAAPEPGAIVCRVAPSFIRFGHFELPSRRGDVDLLSRLVDFTIRRDFSASGLADTTSIDESRRAEWFGEVCQRTAHTIAGWMRVGFVHGVMNTDNLSILGLTIDYGPYGWIEDYDPDWTPNTTDAQGRRYRFGDQAQIAYWNLGRLAQALVPVFESTDPLHAGLQRFVDTFTAVDRDNTARKFGFASCGDDDMVLMRDLQALLHDAEVDMTLFFRSLAHVDIDAPVSTPLIGAFYDEEKRHRSAATFDAWLARYAARTRADASTPGQRVARMQAANPRYVLRNYLAQEAIDRATVGDDAGIHDLLEVMRHPYTDQPGREAFSQRRPDWARHRAGCSMLSCSS